MATPDISVLILTKNEEGNIGRCLEQIFSQAITRQYEVIIVDSGSTDGTLAIAARFPVRLYQIRPEEFSHSRTRNYIAGLAEGRYLVFLAGDARPCNSEWLANLIMPLATRSELSAVYGRQCPKQDTIPVHQFRLDWLYGDDEILKDFNVSVRDRRLFFFSTVNCAIEKAVWRKFRFNEQRQIFEDIDFSLRILRAGHKILYNPKAAVFHAHNIGLSGTFSRYYRIGLVYAQAGIAAEMNQGLEGEGVRYAMSEVLFLLKILRFYWIPYSLLHNMAKYLGFLFGRHDRQLLKIARRFMTEMPNSSASGRER